MMEEVDFTIMEDVEATMLAEGPVEMSVWEQDKENIRPSRAGRNPAKLAEAVLCHRRLDEQIGSTQSFDETRRLEREDFESRLALLAEAAARSSREDANFTQNAMTSLVQLWCDYARWAAEWYPAHSHEERSVLERATSFLSEKPSCSGDFQHLRLWLRLVDFLKEPQEIFNFLWARGIGLEHAAFYEAWAASLERQCRFSEAEEVLATGRARRAQPVERLAGLCAALAARMHGRVLRSAEESEGVIAPDCLVPAALQRPTFNVLTTAESHSLERPADRRVVQGSSLGLDTIGITGPPSHPIECFNEAASGESHRASIFNARSTWALPPAREQTASKENLSTRVRMPEQVASGRPRRRNADRQGGPAPGPEGGLAIFVDEELRDEGLSPPSRRIRTTATMPQPPTDAPSAPSQAPSQASGTPPHQNARSGGTPLPTDLNSATRTARPPPDAPGRDGRRRRPSAADLADDLAAGLSSLRLSNLPPAKRARGVGLVAFGDGPLQLPRDAEITDASVSVPGEKLCGMYCEGDVVARAHSTAMDTTDLMQTPQRPQSLKNVLFGDSSGRAPPPVVAVTSPQSSDQPGSESARQDEATLAGFGRCAHPHGCIDQSNVRGSASSCGMGINVAQVCSNKKNGMIGSGGGLRGGRPTSQDVLISSTRLLVFEDSPCA